MDFFFSCILQKGKRNVSQNGIAKIVPVLIVEGLF